MDHDRYRFCCFRSHVAIVSDFSLQDRFAKIRQFLSGGRFVSFSVYKLFQNSVYTPNNECNQAKSPINIQISVISDHQSTVIVHPPKATLNDPTPAVSLSHTDGTATTGFAAFSLNGGNGGLDSSSAQPDSERTAVISFVSHQFLGPRSGTSPPLRYPNRFQGGFR